MITHCKLVTMAMDVFDSIEPPWKFCEMKMVIRKKNGKKKKLMILNRVL